MRRRSLRWSAAFLLPLVASLASADDPVVPGAKIPRFAAKDVLLKEAGLPEGWKTAPADPQPAEEKALREGIAAAASASAEPDNALATAALLTPEQKAVVVAVVESQRDPAAFSAAAKDVAAKNGWSFRELGTPARVVLVVGPEAAREQALKAQTAAVVRYLAERMAEKFKAWHDGDARSAMPAYAFAQDVLGIDPKHAPSHLVKGDMIIRMAQNGRADAKLEDAIVHYRAATAKDATSPLTGEPLVEAYGMLGESLLNVEPPQDAAGRDALKEAVQRLPGSKIRPETSQRFRYNLACAHGRLKEKDAAFVLIAALLEDLAKTPNPQIDELWRADPDLALLHEEPRWVELVKKYPPKEDAGGK